MKVIDTHFEGLKVIIPKVYNDDRGYFYESFNSKKYQANGLVTEYLQDNEAYSSYGVIRGLHFQKGEFSQGKLVRVVLGEILDVVVDMRKDMPTYGKTFSLILNDIGKKQLYIPPGFAHGYSVLSQEVIFSYKCTTHYNPEAEGGIHPLDPRLKIDWMIPEGKRIISIKDLDLPIFKD
jgi:dTDP-4-dehydrorhamnose 3,5-epimerase